MSMAPATASSSSSQSSSESWQPSQEANFQTASLGLCGGFIPGTPPPPLAGGGWGRGPRVAYRPLPPTPSRNGRGSVLTTSYLLQPKQPPHGAVAHHGAVPADEAAADLT